MPAETDEIAQMTAPDVDAFLKELTHCAPLSHGTRIRDSDRIRFCQWDGQDPSGKKVDQPGKPAFPWVGAADGRPMLADEIIVERAGILESAFWRAAVRPKASESEISSYATALAEHFLQSAMTEQLMTEVALSASYLEQYGKVVLHPRWERRLSLRRVRVTLQELDAFTQQMAQESEQTGESQFRLGDLPAMVMDEEQEDGAVQGFLALYAYWAAKYIPAELDFEAPSLKESTARKAVRALRQDGVAHVPAPYVSHNGPLIYALRYMDDVWAPEETGDLRDARIIFHREWLTEAELRSRVNDGWDKGWIEAAAKTAGLSFNPAELTVGTGGSALNNIASPTVPGQINQPSDLIEVISAIHKAVDEDGVLGIYKTTFSAHIKKGQTDEKIPFAKSELISCGGEYPYVGGRAEHWCRQFSSARGVPEIVSTWQNEAKALDDAVTDFTSIAVLPPVNVPKVSPLGSRYKFGPATQNEVMPGRHPEFMNIPNSGASYALAARDALTKRVANRFALMSETVPPQRWQSSQAVRAQAFLLMWSRAIQQVVDLAVQYMPDDEFSRITGAPIGWIAARRGNLGILGVKLEFDITELDSEITLERIKAVNQVVLPADVQGVLNRTEWVKVMLRAVNPRWARDLVMPAGAASQQMFEAVRNEIAQMYLGNEARYVENDPTAGAKVQFATQIIQGNPQYTAALQQGGRFAELLQKWMQNLQHSVSQQENKQVGRIGVKPGGMQ